MKVSFKMDGGVLNSHLELARLDNKCRAALDSVVAFKSTGSLMDVVSTNGRVLFWTQMEAPKGDDGAYVNFDTIPVLFATSKIPVSRSMWRVCLTIDTDKKECEVLSLATMGKTIERFSVNSYPDWESVAKGGRKRRSSRGMFFPEQLKLIRKYLGDEQAYLSPEGTQPEVWVNRNESEFKRTAMAMSCVPFSGLRSDSLSNRIVNLLEETAEKWNGGKNEKGLAENLLAILKEYDEVDMRKVEMIAEQMSLVLDGKKEGSDAE